MNEADELAERIARDSRRECQYCGHKLADHCKGGEKHPSPKQAQMMSGRNSVTCVGRHCLHPLCSCVEFVAQRRKDFYE